MEIESHLRKFREENFWYRYLEAQIWTDKVMDLHSEGDWISVTPESYSNNGGIECIVNYKAIQAHRAGLFPES